MQVPDGVRVERRMHVKRIVVLDRHTSCILQGIDRCYGCKVE